MRRSFSELLPWESVGGLRSDADDSMPIILRDCRAARNLDEMELRLSSRLPTVVGRLD